MTNNKQEWEERFDEKRKRGEFDAYSELGLGWKPKEVRDFIQQELQKQKEEIERIITQHYIPGHMVVNPTLEAIIKQIKNLK